MQIERLADFIKQAVRTCSVYGQQEVDLKKDRVYRLSVDLFGGDDENTLNVYNVALFEINTGKSQE